MKNLILATFLTAATTFSAHADTIVLSAPMAGGTVHTDDVDMSVYWTPSDEAFEVVALYVPVGADTAPQKLQMRLDNGDSVTFGLPGFDGATYNFERNADSLTVTGTQLPVAQKLN